LLYFFKCPIAGRSIDTPPGVSSSISIDLSTYPNPNLNSLFYPLKSNHAVHGTLSLIEKREKELGKEDKKEKNDDPEFIKSILAVHDNATMIVSDYFHKSGVFQKAQTEAFVDIVNRNAGEFTNAELMCSFCDRILKTGEKLSDEEVQTYLEKIVDLLTYLTDKDLFKEIYKNQLAKRLLNQKSASHDLEKLCISQIKLKNGTAYTSHFEGMMNDLAVSEAKEGESSKSKYLEYLKKNKKESPSVDFNVSVLTVGNWPTYKHYEDLSLPPEMQESVASYEKFHYDMNASRKLAWNYSQGTCVVRGTFGDGKKKKTYDMTVTTLQAVAFTALNDGVELEFEELRKKMNVEEAVLKVILHSLCCGKYQVIAKDPKGKKIKTSDKYRANPKFTANQHKFKIPMASLEASHNPKAIDDSRKHAIEAAIVRIMKSRKVSKVMRMIMGGEQSARCRRACVCALCFFGASHKA